MSSEADHKKLNKLKTSPLDRHSEDYTHTNEDPDDSSKKRGTKSSSQRSSNQPNYQKSVSLSAVGKTHSGSLEALNEDIKNTAPTMNAPTFGEDELNAVVKDQVLSVPPGKKGNFSKIDMLLEEHKKRKALQNYYEFQNDDESPSPMSVKAKSPKDSEKTPVGFPQGDQELLLSPIEPKSLPAESQSALQATNSDIHSFRYENGKQPFIVQEQYQFHQSPDSPDNDFGGFVPGLASQHEETGRFKGSARSVDFNDKNVSSDLKEKYQLPSKFVPRERANSNKATEKKDYKRTDSTASKYSSVTSNTNNSNANNNNNNNNNGIPKISENSRKIFQNSQRAKEDELLIQSLLKDHVRKLSSGATQDSPEAQNVLEESESPSPKNKFVRLPSSASPKSDKEQSRISINFAAEEKKSRSPNHKSTASGNSSMVNNTIPQNSSFAPSSFLSASKRSTSKKAFVNQNASAEGTSPSSSPKNFKSSTVVEHKKRPSRLDEYISSYRKRTGAVSANVSPTVKEIKEMANASKSIYLRMAKKEIKPEAASASPKRQSKASSPKANNRSRVDVMGSKLVQKCAENAKRPTVNRLGAEVNKYDEVQRLDIMMYNLRHIQRNNLIELYTFRVNNPKPPGDIVYTTKTNWNTYADEINEVASERRWFRRMEEEERIARMASPPSPRPMEKVDLTVDGLMASTQLRQQMYLSTEEEKANLKSWSETGLYDRSVMWLAVRDQKVNQMSYAKAVDEMRDCVFQPQLHQTQAYNSSFIGSYSRAQTETPPSFLQSLSERFQSGKHNQSGLTGMLTEKSIYRNEKSLYKERKSLETYSDIFDLKKAYNLYSKGTRDTTQRTSNSVMQ